MVTVLHDTLIHFQIVTLPFMHPETDQMTHRNAYWTKRTKVFISHHIRLPPERFRSPVHTLPMYQLHAIFPSTDWSPSSLNHIHELIS